MLSAAAHIVRVGYMVYRYVTNEGCFELKPPPEYYNDDLKIMFRAIFRG